MIIFRMAESFRKEFTTASHLVLDFPRIRESIVKRPGFPHGSRA